MKVINFLMMAILAVGSYANATNVCDTRDLKAGDYAYYEQGKVRADVKLKVLGGGEIALKVTGADRYSSFRDGAYTLKLTQAQDSNLYPCDLRVFNSNGAEIVPLSNPELPAQSTFHSTSSLGTSVANGKVDLYMETSGFTGCSNEGTPDQCPPEEAQLIKL